MDKVTFVGTGGGRVIISTQLRGTGGFVLNIANRQIYVDPGPGALIKACEYGVAINKTDIVFVSHHHIDHVNDLNAIVDAMTLGGIHKRGVLITTPTVLHGSQNCLPWIQPFYKENLKEYFALLPHDVVKINGLDFIATRTIHDDPCIGFKLVSPKITISYTSDTAYSEDLHKDFEGTDVLIVNVLRPGNEHWKTHLSSGDAAKLISEVKPELAIIQHFGAKMIRANPIYEARWIQQKTQVRTLAACDGMKLDLNLR